MAFDCEGYCEIYRETFHVARKEHKCCECRTPILPGETYAYIFMLYDGDTSVFKQHLCCWSMARHINLDLVGMQKHDDWGGGYCAFNFGEIRQFFIDNCEYSFKNLSPMKNCSDGRYQSLKVVWEMILKGWCRDWRRPNENPDDNLEGIEK